MSEQHGSFGVTGTGDTSGYSGLVRTSISSGSTERPFGGYFDDVADDLERAFPAFNDAIEKNKPRITIGKDAKTMDILTRLNPIYAAKLIYKQMKSLLN